MGTVAFASIYASERRGTHEIKAMFRARGADEQRGPLLSLWLAMQAANLPRGADSMRLL